MNHTMYEAYNVFIIQCMSMYNELDIVTHVWLRRLTLPCQSLMKTSIPEEKLCPNVPTNEIEIEILQTPLNTRQ